MNLIHKLQQDHHYLSQVLTHLQHHLNQEAPELALINEVLLFIEDYAEQYHHPIEDQLLSHLSQHLPHLNEMHQHLLVEHLQLQEHTDHLREQLTQAEQGNLLPWPQLRQAVSSWISAQKHHIEKEDQHMLPLLEAGLAQHPFQAAPLPKASVYLSEQFRQLCNEL